MGCAKSKEPHGDKRPDVIEKRPSIHVYKGKEQQGVK